MVLQENNDYPLIEFNRKFINLRKIFFKAKDGSYIPIMGYIDSLCMDLIVFLAKKENVEYIENNRLISIYGFLKRKYPNFLPNENDIHPSEEAYKAISKQIIAVINKTLLNT